MTLRREPLRKGVLTKLTRPVATIVPIRRRVPVLNICPGAYEAYVSVARLTFLNDDARRGRRL